MISRLDYNYLRSLMLRYLGIDISIYKVQFIYRRLIARMRALNLNSIEEYIVVLKRNPQELSYLLDNMTINVSQFFRDPHVWRAVREEVFKPIIDYKRSRGRRVIRIWSAGCARGEEPYTISMILHELLGPTLNGLTVTILATDIDPNAIEAAKLGGYDPKSLATVPPSLIRKYFYYDNMTGKYVVKDTIKRIVKFKVHDVTRHPPITLVDVIFCRYLLIYIAKDVQLTVLSNFYRALSSGGYLVLGASEFLPEKAYSMFETVNLRARIYRKRLNAD